MRLGWRLTLGLVAGISLWDLSAQATEIYVTRAEHGGLPLYTDRPIGADSRRLFVVNDPPPLRRAGSQAAVRGASRLAAARREAVQLLVHKAARAHDLDAALLLALIEVESGFDPRARSVKGAMGLMQVMPATAARFGNFDLFDVEQNLEAGARYLKKLQRQFDGDLRLVLAAYNAGENAVLRHGHRVPNYPETQNYVPTVLERYRHYRASAQPPVR